MATIAEVLEQAAAQHRAGNLPAAEQLCRAILQVAPDRTGRDLPFRSDCMPAR